MLRDCIRREIKSAIPEKEKRGLAYHQRPLFAWIQGAHKVTGKSPIECVKENKTSWPWTTLNASGNEFVRRISKKKNLCFVQRTWLYDYIAKRYQGHYKDGRYNVRDVHYFVDDKHGLITRAIYDLVSKCLEKEKVTEPPLRLIFSQEFALLIDIKTMEMVL